MLNNNPNVVQKLQSTLKNFMKEPHLTNLLGSMVRNLEQSIPQMISFVDGDVDQHSWERCASATFISDSETEIDLLKLIQGVLNAASIPAIFGSGLIEKYPNLIHDLHDMEAGMPYFMMGLPAWIPFPTIGRAYLARQRVLRAMDSFQEALDALVDDESMDFSWGNLDDVSELIMNRHAIYKGKELVLHHSILLKLSACRKWLWGYRTGRHLGKRIYLKHSVYHTEFIPDNLGTCCQRRLHGLLAPSVHSRNPRPCRSPSRRDRPVR